MDDEVRLLGQLGLAQARMVQGDRAGARALYEALWAQADQQPDRYAACVVAHFLAHIHTDAETQREWHLRALQAADAVADARVRTFYPSLHANLAEVYLRLRQPAPARQHLAHARAALARLPDDGYDESVHLLIARVAQNLEENDSYGA
jgi:hypothetical protein